jgi:hypothetical protein
MIRKSTYEKPEAESITITLEHGFCGPSNPATNTQVSDLYDSDDVTEEEW